MAESWLSAAGQRRGRPLCATLVAARQAAAAAGVTRLADVSGLASCGVAVFQAVRPLARLLSVSQGKGLSPMAAMVSALLEAVELDVAERLGAASPLVAPDRLGPDAIDLWCGASRDALGIRLEPSRARGWQTGRNLTNGRDAPLPWDLLSLDACRPLPPDVKPSSVGLATGNDAAEAAVGAVAELIEHDLLAAFASFGPRDWRSCQLDLDSVDDPVAGTLLRRLAGRGYAVRVWSMGHGAGVAAFRCAITDLDRPGTPLPPAGGSGCHPDRTVALLRAVLEAVQSRITLIAGARDDLTMADYRDGRKRSLELLFGSLAFGPGPLAWSAVPQQPTAGPAADLDVLLGVVARQTSLPVLLFTHQPPHPDLAVVHALAPGLRDLHRAAAGAVDRPWPAPPVIRRTTAPILFIGPSLPADQIPQAIEVRPPATCGDLAALLADPPPAVGIVDGCFETAPTIWHKEILDLIALGVPVLGGASLGAIRAAELHRHGMIGVGAIFAAYCDGSLRRDDAVMLSHGPAELGYPSLTVALVDAEAALGHCAPPLAERRQLLRIVRTLPFTERTWVRCLEVYRARTGAVASVTLGELSAAPSRKQADARLMVAALLTATPGAKRPRPPITPAYAALLASRSQVPESDHRLAARHVPIA